MKVVRIVSKASSDTADLISFLQSRGFVVQVGHDTDSPAADFEIDLRRYSVEDALSFARELAADEIDVFIAPGIFAAPQSAAMEIQPEVQDVSPAEEPAISTHSYAVEEPEPIPEESYAEPLRPSTWSRLHENITQIFQEARLTTRECFRLCSAELLNRSEQTSRWLAERRVLLVRKRTLVETRAIRARAIVENRLRLDSKSQNAWIRSAFAGAGVMVVLLALMLWNDQRFASSDGAVSSAAAASVLKSESTRVSGGPATSTPGSAVLPRHQTAGRAELADGREVIIRHFQRPVSKATVAVDTKSGIKHISDMN